MIKRSPARQTSSHYGAVVVSVPAVACGVLLRADGCSATARVVAPILLFR